MQHGDHFLTSIRAVFGMTKVKCLTGVVSGKDDGENLKIAKFSHTSKLFFFFSCKGKRKQGDSQREKWDTKKDFLKIGGITISFYATEGKT